MSIGEPETIPLLIEELCANLGFCLPPDDQERIATTVWKRADDLTNAVFRAKGMEPPFDVRLWRDVHTRARARLSWDSA